MGSGLVGASVCVGFSYWIMGTTITTVPLNWGICTHIYQAVKILILFV